jgi:transcription initiation factor TFIID subunit 3
MFHAFLRPSILQILRATGYHSTRPAVLDTLTDIAARYLTLLCEKTAGNAANNHGDAGDYDVVDVRMALQEVGALLPDQAWRQEEDMRGVEEFIGWFAGPRMREMMEMGSGDTESDATDYLAGEFWEEEEEAGFFLFLRWDLILTDVFFLLLLFLVLALKKKHSKTGDDAKWQGTIFGKSTDGNEILVEGGPITSISEWISQRAPEPRHPPRESAEQEEGHDHEQEKDKEQQDTDKDGDKPEATTGSGRSPSSGLSSVGDRLGGDAAEDMDLS